MDVQNQAPVQYRSDVPGKKKEKRLGLAIASLVLGGLSLLCCWAYGLGIAPGLIATVFGIIAVVSGEGKARVMGAVGMILGIVGVVMAVVVLMYYATLINWENVTLSNLSQFRYVDPDDPQEVERWLQQFFNIDISGILD